MIDRQADYSPAPTMLVVAESDAAARPGADAIAAVGARMLARVGIADAMARIDDAARVDAVVIELRGGDDGAIGDLLPRIDTLAKRRDLHAVVAFDHHQIDLVAGAMLGNHVQLLCDPDDADRTAALALSGAVGARLNDPRRDESERLRALNSEVARIADTLARLSRSADTGARGGAIHPGAPDEGDDIAIDAPTVRSAIRARRLRANFFGAELFADPAWDMLLDLFAAELEFARVSVSSLCIAAAVPGPTALRWIGTLLDRGVFERAADPLDRRRAYISLSAQASEGMRRYFAAIRRAGLASG